ncbi:hypothetical protein [Jiangella asiatica]|uniref:Uncharacterized protein n=1 Tax=Jiangella asiatica TaxID=2530372 RepID=A0A4R5DUS4_9ACTN|nr:hypothetical protein [Jiangella asiatica]TDE15901.1 hypothetical protein E1269_00995 [Jiangella asiatica]
MRRGRGRTVVAAAALAVASAMTLTGTPASAVDNGGAEVATLTADGDLMLEGRRRLHHRR